LRVLRVLRVPNTEEKGDGVALDCGSYVGGGLELFEVHLFLSLCHVDGGGAPVSILMNIAKSFRCCSVKGK
jgi:hypothetical protein